MTDDSQPTEPERTSFDDVGRIQRAMIQAGMVEQAIAPLPTREELLRIEELPVWRTDWLDKHAAEVRSTEPTPEEIEAKKAEWIRQVFANDRLSNQQWKG